MPALARIKLLCFVKAILLVCCIVEVYPWEMGRGKMGFRTKRHIDEKEKTAVDNLKLFEDIKGRYLAELLEYGERSVPEVINHPPVINVYTLQGEEYPQVRENASPGEFVAFVEVADPDKGKEGMVDCRIDQDRKQFELVKTITEYEIHTIVRLDYEAEKKHVVEIICGDHGRKQVSKKVVEILVIDMNDHPPVFNKESYESSIMENNTPGSLLLQVYAEDGDTGENAEIMYTLTGSARKYLTINRDTGEIFAKTVFLCKNTPEITFHVIAIDKGCVPLSESAEVKLKIIGNNDDKPEFETDTYQFSIPEDLYSNYINPGVGRVKAGADCNQIIYEFASQTKSAYGQTFGIHNRTGDIFMTAPVDFEQQKVFVLTVIAKNQNQNQSLVAEAAVVIMVTDVNDNAPVIEINTLTGTDQAEIKQFAVEGFVAHVSVHDMDSGNNGKFQCLTSRGFKLVKLYENEFKIVAAYTVGGVVGVAYNIIITCEDLGDRPMIGSLELTAVVVR